MLGVEIDDGLKPCGKLRADAYPIAAPSQTTADPGRAGGYGHRDLVVGEMRTLFVAGVLLTLSAPAIAAEIHTLATLGSADWVAVCISYLLGCLSGASRVPDIHPAAPRGPSFGFAQSLRRWHLMVR